MLKWERKKKDPRKALMVGPELHRTIKMHCAREGVSIKDFVDNAIELELYLPVKIATRREINKAGSEIKPA